MENVSGNYKKSYFPQKHYEQPDTRPQVAPSRQKKNKKSKLTTDQLTDGLAKLCFFLLEKGGKHGIISEKVGAQSRLMAKKETY